MQGVLATGLTRYLDIVLSSSLDTEFPEFPGTGNNGVDHRCQLSRIYFRDKNHTLATPKYHTHNDIIFNDIIYAIV